MLKAINIAIYTQSYLSNAKIYVLIDLVAFTKVLKRNFFTRLKIKF